RWRRGSCARSVTITSRAAAFVTARSSCAGGPTRRRASARTRRSRAAVMTASPSSGDGEPGDRARDPRAHPAPRALALNVDGARGQRAPERGRRQGRWPPGILRLGGESPHRPLLQGALATRYLVDHGAARSPERFVVMVGDAELDEGNVWEALGEEPLAQLGDVLWIVDVNRQSLDRVIPDARTRQLADLFRAHGWRV